MAMSLDDQWINDLENLLADGCSANDIYCVCKGRTLPDSLRAEVWQACLDVRYKGNQLDHHSEVFDLSNQFVLHQDCTDLVSNLQYYDDEALSSTADLESILTFFCKSRKLKYVKSNGWIELLLPIVSLKIGRAATYNLFEAILDSYIPQSCNNNNNAFHILRLLLQYHDPELCSFLDTKRITPEKYCLSWFQSLFAATCHLQAVTYMWDFYFQQSDPFFIFFLSLIMVVNSRETIMSMKDESIEIIIKTIADMPSALEADDVNDFCSLAQYYASKTPNSFRTEFMETLYNGKETDSLVSQALCLPVSVHELLENSSQDFLSPDRVRFFLVDCRPIEQYNAGHLPTAFHLDCNLMLQEPCAFSTAVQGLLSAQKQALAHNSRAGGEHFCFLGSGRNEEDQYTNMVVASFLQKNTQYVSLLTAGYQAIHNYFPDPHEILQDHSPQHCILCSPYYSLKKAEDTPKVGNSNYLFGKISAAMKSKSVEVKDKLIDYIVNPSNNTVQERHVSYNDKIGKRYREVAPVFSIDDDHDNFTNFVEEQETTREIVQLQTYLKQPEIIEQFACQEVKRDGTMCKSHLLITTDDLIVLHDVQSPKGAAEVVMRRPMSSIVQITARKRHPDLITFKYGSHDGDTVNITGFNRFIIPNGHRATKVVTDQILKRLKPKV